MSILYGTNAADIFVATNETDIAYGEGGRDTFVFSGKIDDYFISSNYSPSQDWAAVVQRKDGLYADDVDVLHNVEILQFADGIYEVDTATGSDFDFPDIPAPTVPTDQSPAVPAPVSPGTGDGDGPLPENPTAPAAPIVPVPETPVVQVPPSSPVPPGKPASTSFQGSTRNDRLVGSDGNDTIYGAKGADKLFGGSGKDTFLYKALSDSTVSAKGQDTIFDFTKTDKINLSAIDANTKLKGNQAFSFIGKAEFHGKAGELKYEKSGSHTIIYGDVNGDAKADFSIRLDDAMTMVKGFFLL